MQDCAIYPTTPTLANTCEFEQVCSIIDQHTARALSLINQEHLATCWEIGAYISQRLKDGKWGDKIVRELANYIRLHRPNNRGYSRTNLYYMVRFYETYTDSAFTHLLTHYQDKLPIVQSTTGQSSQFVQSAIGQMPNILPLVTYTHHTIILNRCDSPMERLFYILYSGQQNLNTRELDKCISNRTFEALVGRSEKDIAPVMTQIYPTSRHIFKDRLMLDSLALPPKHKESKLHSEILAHMKDFILELGKEDFFFVQDEYPISVGGDTFHLDLLFYHRVLHCYVGVELKAGKFKPQDIGQLEFYLEALDRDKRRENEGPSIGILLCRDANRMVVEYALSRSMSPVMIAQYRQSLIPIEILQKAFDEYIEYNSPQVLKP